MIATFLSYNGENVGRENAWFYVTLHTKSDILLLMKHSLKKKNARRCRLQQARTFLLVCSCLALAGCSEKTSIIQGEWSLSYHNGIDIRHGKETIASNLTAEYRLGGSQVISTKAYEKHSFTEERIADAFGEGKLWTITYTSRDLPTLTHHFYIYDDCLLTSLQLAVDSGVCTNYMAPIVLENVHFPIPDNQRALFVPYDNDAWIRFTSRELNDVDTLRSYEVTAIYNAQSRKGLVVGAIDHDNWKNAVDLTGHANELRAYSGVADTLTRDCLPHGTVQGRQVSSARIMIGLFDDWRLGLEHFASVNATVTPPRHWEKAMPVGWNSWGALAFKVNHDNASRISDFFAEELQSHSFVNSEGLLYTGLDSGWNNFKEEELKDFADRCHRNHQVPCIYWTPFTDWGKNPERGDLLLAGGKPQELDGAFALDPTHPAVRQAMEQTHDLFRRCGFKYVKMDFMTHGRLEADRWYRKDITTGTQAYNYGMHLLDSIFSDMYLNLSISPIFPAQYAQSRRIACDAWNKIKDTEYTMNALSYGWWIDGVYQYNDADHVVLRDATEAENRARITSSVITGLYITGDDFSADTTAIRRARQFLTNPDINRLATGRSFRPLVGDSEQSEHVFVRTEDDGTTYLTVFNYSDEPLPFSFDRQLLQLPPNTRYNIEELWSHQTIATEEMTTISPKDVMLFRIKKK